MNTICRAECNFGYQLEGTSTAVCTTQGNWNPKSSPKCTGKNFCVMISATFLGEGMGQGGGGGVGVSVGSV